MSRTHSRPTWVTAVSGSTRCGTTLVMEMLHHGGIPAYADNLDSFETRKIFSLPREWAWLVECSGRCLKLLEPLHLAPLPAIGWRFILMRRDPIEQAKSQVKLLRALGGMDVAADAVPTIAESLRRDYPKMRRQLVRAGPTMELAFEDVLARPLASAERIAMFLGLDLDTTAMAGVVVPRPPECLPGLLELDRYAARAAARGRAV